MVAGHAFNAASGDPLGDRIQTMIDRIDRILGDALMKDEPMDKVVAELAEALPDDTAVSPEVFEAIDNFIQKEARLSNPDMLNEDEMQDLWESNQEAGQQLTNSELIAELKD